MARPTFKPTAAQRRTVAVAAGGGLSHEEIAAGLGISRNTLEKHFETELFGGAAAKRLEIINAMFTAAKKGNVAAQKAYTALAIKVIPPADPVSKPAAKAKGKKEQAQVDAAEAQTGSDWESLLPVGSAPIQ